MVEAVAPSKASAREVQHTGGDCPSVGAVWRRAVALVGQHRLPDEPPSSLVVHDEGDRYRIAVVGESAQHADPKRDCAQRAEVGAVFVVLVLAPPDVRDVPPNPADRTWQIEAAPWAGSALFSGGLTRWTGGLSLRGIAARDWVGVAAGFTVTLPVDVVAVAPAPDSSPARERRLTGDVSARLIRRAAGWQLGLEAGFVVSALQLQPIGAAATTTMDWGGRAAATVGLTGLTSFGAMAPFVGVFAEVSLGRRSLAFEPVGVVAASSLARGGLLVGLAWKIR